MKKIPEIPLDFLLNLYIFKGLEFQKWGIPITTPIYKTFTHHIYGLSTKSKSLAVVVRKKIQKLLFLYSANTYCVLYFRRRCFIVF